MRAVAESPGSSPNRTWAMPAVNGAFGVSPHFCASSLPPPRHKPAAQDADLEADYRVFDNPQVTTTAIQQGNCQPRLLPDSLRCDGQHGVDSGLCAPCVRAWRAANHLGHPQLHGHALEAAPRPRSGIPEAEEYTITALPHPRRTQERDAAMLARVRAYRLIICGGADSICTPARLRLRCRISAARRRTSGCALSYLPKSTMGW
jgi:hypothetical protein